MYLRYIALSDIHSAIIYFAPVIASSTSFTLSVIYSLATSSILIFTGNDIIILASGSSPKAIASVALVFFFSLYGLYKSSTSTNFSHFIISNFNSSVSIPFSSMSLITSSFLFNKLTWYSYTSFIFLICSSSNAPVASFLYLAINGTVLLSSKSFNTFSTCLSFTLSSLAICNIIFWFILILLQFTKLLYHKKV